MATFITLLVLLLSAPVFGVENLGGMPQETDTGVDKQVREPPSQPSRPTPVPDKRDRDATAEIESPRRSEVSGKSLDDPEKAVDWQFIGVVVAVIGGIILPIILFSLNSGKTEKAIAKGIEEGLRKFLTEINAEAVSKNPDEAAETAARVQRDTTSSQTDRSVAAAVQLQQQGKIEEAIEKWRSIAHVVGEEDHQLQARSWFSIGYLRGIREGADLVAAIDAYTKAIELNPAYAEAYNNRGNAKNNLGDHAAALEDCDRAIELNPALAAAYNNRGNAKAGLGDHAAALTDYDRAIELNPALAEAYNNRGNAKAGLGEPQAALADFDRAIELNPAFAEAL